MASTIDPNAVEVCKLALLLKMLEHENVATRHEADLDATDEQILPDLGGNIKCGKVARWERLLCRQRLGGN